MCGIVGMLGNINKKEKEAFDLLLMLDEVRGPHSTGVLTVGLEDFNLFKKAIPAYDFQTMRGYERIMQRPSRLLLGHNRWATQGAVNSVNAHPFEHGDIIGVHNGTLRNQSLLPDHKNFEVDSENLIYSIDELGIEDTWSKLSGAAALVWWDNDDKVLNMVRNEERPLSFTTSKDGTALFWASESLMLSYALNSRSIPHEKITSLPTHELHQWEVESWKLTNSKPAVSKLKPYTVYTPPKQTHTYTPKKKTEVKAAKKFIKTEDHMYPSVNEVIEFFVYSSGGNGKHFLGFEAEGELPVKVYPNSDQTLIAELDKSMNNFEGTVVRIDMSGEYIINPKTISVIEEEEEDTSSDWDKQRFGVFNEKEVGVQEWLNLTHRGCCQCTAQPNIEENELLIWTGPNEFYCGDCVTTSEEYTH